MKKFLTLSAILFAVSAMAAENLVNVSWGDSIMVGSGISKLDTPEKVEANIMIQCLVDTFEEIIEQGTTVNFGIVPFSSTEETYGVV